MPVFDTTRLHAEAPWSWLWRRVSALLDAVERDDLTLARRLVEGGETPDEDVFYRACEQSDTRFLDVLWQPRFAHENMINHKLDFEDVSGVRWFLDRHVDVNEHRALHHALARGRRPA